MEEASGCTSWMKLSDRYNYPVRLEGVGASRLHVFPPGVQLCDLRLTREMTVALSYKG